MGTSFHTLVHSRAGKVHSDCAVSWGVAVLLWGVGLGSHSEVSEVGLGWMAIL